MRVKKVRKPYCHIHRSKVQHSKMKFGSCSYNLPIAMRDDQSRGKAYPIGSHTNKQKGNSFTYSIRLASFKILILMKMLPVFLYPFLSLDFDEMGTYVPAFPSIDEIFRSHRTSLYFVPMFSLSSLVTKW